MAAKKPRPRKSPITQVYYQTSTEVAPYRHKHCGAMRLVMPGESPEQAAAEAARWVHQQLGIATPPPGGSTLRFLGDEKK